MRKEFEKGSPENTVFRDIYLMAEDYAIAEDTDEYKDGAFHRADAILRKYQGTSAEALAFGLVHGLDRYITDEIKKLRGME